mgnify:CR=1 FL=1
MKNQQRLPKQTAARQLRTVKSVASYCGAHTLAYIGNVILAYIGAYSQVVKVFDNEQRALGNKPLLSADRSYNT